MAAASIPKTQAIGTPPAHLPSIKVFHRFCSLTFGIVSVSGRPPLNLAGRIHGLHHPADPRDDLVVNQNPPANDSDTTAAGGSMWYGECAIRARVRKCARPRRQNNVIRRLSVWSDPNQQSAAPIRKAPGQQLRGTVEHADPSATLDSTPFPTDPSF